MAVRIFLISFRGDYMWGFANVYLCLFDCIFGEKVFVRELWKQGGEGGVPVSNIRGDCGKNGWIYRDWWLRERVWRWQRYQWNFIWCLAWATHHCQALLAGLLSELSQHHWPLLQFGCRRRYDRTHYLFVIAWSCNARF